MRARHVVAVAAATLLSLPTSAGALGFARADYLTGDPGGPGYEESGSAVADFNRDGRPDVAVVSQFSTTGPRVMLNRGDGTFTTPGLALSLGFDLGTVAAAELNGDGKPDLVAGDDTSIRTLLGNGDGTFRPAGSVSVLQGGQTDVAVVDADRDGRQDVIVLLRSGARTLLGNGDGTLRSGPLSVIPSPALSGLEPANLDGDAAVDLVAADALAQQVYALKGRGDGGFDLRTTAPSALVPGTILAGDFNGDGRDDVAALNEFNFVVSAVVLLNDGTGAFGLPALYDAGLNPASGALGDLNRDGRLDIVSSDTSGSQQVVLLGDGRGAFTTAAKAGTASYPQTPVVADFDGDGRTDIAAAGSSSPVGAGGIALSVLRQLP